MADAFLSHITDTLAQIESEGLYKRERMITSPQGGEITVGGKQVINLCANNYLGLADHPALIEAATQAMGPKGFGMASVRFICGTQDIHRELEQRLANFLNKDDSILFAACFDANGGLFEPLLGPEDAIISDSLNHASIIDGVRLCKAKRYRYMNNDMNDLEAWLKQAREDGARHIMIATDGVFSMDGYLANLPKIRELADKYDAIVMVDDCHATGFMGPNGAGTPDHFGVDVDILTGTLGKALGGNRRLYRRAAASDRPAAAAGAALSVLKLAAALDRRCRVGSDPPGRRRRHAARATVWKRQVLARWAGKAWL